ncbi:MAG: 30S ribosomal protein S12 methylthiotransferase RimO [Phycisphaerales bacterium]|nr:30S ribosomal protein S12 methylthiotransferase RimO [Phycisphaerales bacterium]
MPSPRKNARNSRGKPGTPAKRTGRPAAPRATKHGQPARPGKARLIKGRGGHRPIEEGTHLGSGVRKLSAGAKKSPAATPAPGKKPGASAKPAKSRDNAADTEVSTVSFVSLGCPKNLVDSEKMLGLLAQDGILPVSYSGDGFDGADAVVVNTCGFLEASKDESLGVIHEAIREKERGNVKRVVVAGCLVQRHRAKMLEWAPGIDAMVGVFDRDKIVEAVRGVAPARERADTGAPKYWIAANALTAAKDRGVKTVGLTVQGKDGKGIGYFEDDSARLRLTPRHYAYLRISEGCNQNCAFCTIPSIRGKMRSKGVDRIAAEARELVNDGAFELLLIGQDTTSFGDDIGAGLAAGAGSAPRPHDMGGLPSLLARLSETLDELGSQGWLRLMYAYPSNFSEPIIDAFAALSTKRGSHLLPYIDMPLQHASDRVLSLMRRHVTREQQAGVIRRLRERVPDMTVRTTFISGFPGETEDDHGQLLEFIEEMKFDAVGVFEYSREDGTVAGTMENDPALAVPAEVKTRRRNEVMELQQKIAFERQRAVAAKFDENNPESSGVRMNVLIDEATRTQGRKTSGVSTGGGLYMGRTRAQAPQIDSATYVQSREKLSPGELVACVIVASDGYDLVARPIADIERRVGLKILK